MADTIPISPPHLAAVALEKTYRTGTNTVSVLRGVNLEIHQGEFLTIIGQSGSGKSTLLHLLGLLDVPDIGEVQLEGKRIDHLPARTKDELRNRVFGFVFQSYHLLPELTLIENVLSPLMIRYSTWEYWKRRRELKDQAKELLAQVGLGHRLKHKPNQLSGGEMQRAAIARALITEPSFLLADEPTGNLDVDTGKEIIDLLCKLNSERQLTIAMVTHDEAIAKRSQRIVRLYQGQTENIRRKVA